MSLPESWVSELFGRLSVRYGAAFLRQWPDAPAEAVKADWARVLRGFQGRHIQHALDHLPESPPNAMQFRSLCLMAPEPKPLQIAGPKPQRAKVEDLVKRMKAALDTEGKGPAFAAQRLREIAKTRPLTQAQKAALAECESAHEPVSMDMGIFRPIPPELWPWNRTQEAA